LNLRIQSIIGRQSSTGLRIIAFYVFAFAAGAVIRPFLNLYLVEIGLTASQIGLIHGWAALAAVVITPLIGLLADRTQRHRLFLGAVTAFKGLSAPLLLVSSAWAWLVVMVSMRVITAGVSDGLLTPLTLKYLKRNQRQDIGSVRFWGGVSFAVTSLLAGWLARGGSVAVLFPLGGVLGILAAFFVGAFPSRVDDQTVVLSPHSRPLANVRQLGFLYLLILLLEFSFSGPETFLNVYLAESLGAGNVLIGLLGTVTWLAMLVGFRAADPLIERHGSVAIMASSFGIYALSWLGFALILRPVFAIPFVAVQGAGQAFYLISLFILLSHLGLPGRASTDLVLVQMTVPGLARMVAQPVSGWVYDLLGGRTLFVVDALIVLLAMALLLSQRQRLKKSQNISIGE
jgi:PPP family 3-phenylpropionic acid transporter